MRARDLVICGIVAAIYAVLVFVVSPISYGPIQFRMAEVLKPLAFWGPPYIWGLTIGLVVANTMSPYAGIWELLFMPIMCFVGGYITWYLGKKLSLAWFLKGRHTWYQSKLVSRFIAGFFYALWMSGAVALMLSFVLDIPFLPVWLSVTISEVGIIVLVGVPLTDWIMRRINERKSAALNAREVEYKIKTPCVRAADRQDRHSPYQQEVHYCYICGAQWVPEGQKLCPDCGFIICPVCGGCFCKLSNEDKAWMTAVYSRYCLNLDNLREFEMAQLPFTPNASLYIGFGMSLLKCREWAQKGSGTRA